ncbi:GNAT family N-acetyltransferase [Deinococcus sp. AJ005]|uniref:GNAT family N-acetyltransferase n=1 Tax=Deinococcus sp. AJ005 TaxID=2652443 RepID=UPI00125CA6C5|nr:GNAT family N-acetyltransferase [Deinococcus sp. AJ005]QFP77746.1 GNAT family N-acetyltransferase [Deinococcus sp. AJ005]
MSLTVRPIQDGEWDAAARVLSLAQPHEPWSAEELQKRGQEQDAWDYTSGVLVAVLEGELCGMAAYSQNPGAYHPQRYVLELAVDPAQGGKGLGGALWTALEAELRGHGAQEVRILAREDHPVAPGFLERRGFTAGKRYFTGVLDVTAFDGALYRDLPGRLVAQGVRIRSLTELRAADTPDLDARLHTLMSDVRGDVPRDDPATPLSFHVFRDAVLDDPGLLPEGYLVAEVGDEWIGQTTLFRSEASPDLFTGLTGVTRGWRGRGVAMALKVAAIGVARDLGAPTIRTDNASDNAPMLRVNERLGFVRDPATVSHLRKF